MRIRPARIGDGLTAIKLYKELVGDETAVAEGPLGAKRWAAIVTHSGTSVFVAELPKDGVVGMVTLHVLPNVTFGGQSYALVENMVVAKANRGQGVGRALMEEAIKAAWKSDCFQIVLLSGKDLDARGFYEKLGFTAAQKEGLMLRRSG